MAYALIRTPNCEQCQMEPELCVQRRSEALDENYTMNVGSRPGHIEAAKGAAKCTSTCSFSMCSICCHLFRFLKMPSTTIQNV